MGWHALFGSNQKRLNNCILVVPSNGMQWKTWKILKCIHISQEIDSMNLTGKSNDDLSSAFHASRSFHESNTCVSQHSNNAFPFTPNKILTSSSSIR